MSSTLAWEAAAKATALLLIPLAAAWLRPAMSADCRVRLILACLGGAVAVAVSTFAAPELTVWETRLTSDPPPALMNHVEDTVPFRDDITRPAARVGAPQEPGQSFTWWLMAYAVASVAAMLLAFVSTIRSWSVMRRLPPSRDCRLRGELERLRLGMNIATPLQLVVQDFSPSPYTWGVRRPVVVVPADFTRWSSRERQAALLHELAHVKRADSLTTVLARLFAAVLWWHPLAWLLVRRLRTEIESACDDLVVLAGVPAVDYAGQLVQVARRRLAMPRGAMAMATPSGLERRVRALLTNQRRRSIMTRSAQSLLWLTLLTSAAALGAAGVAAKLPGDREYLPIFKLAPAYPPAAQSQRVEGHVVVEFDVDESGATRNVRVVEQSPESGVFEAAAIESAKSFHYLPRQEDGINVPVEGVRNRITFELSDDAESASSGSGEFVEIAELTNARQRSTSELTRRIAEAARQAEARRNGDLFLELAEMALNGDLPIAGYLALRATQLGTSSSARLEMVTAMTLFEDGALPQARQLFGRIASRGGENSDAAKEWVTYLDRKMARQAAIHEAVLGLNP